MSAVASTRVEATRAGEHALGAGGTAVDAAVAMAFVLGVVEPYMTGLGAVGEAVVVEADGRCTVLDAAARAPRRAAFDLSAIDGEREVVPADYPWPEVEDGANRLGAKAVAAPQLVAGLGLLHERFGRLAWRDLVAPAVAEAEAGAVYDFQIAALVVDSAHTLRHDPLARQLYFTGDGLPRGTRIFSDVERVTNRELARALHAVADRGPQALVDGWIADAIVATVTAAGGFLAHDDLVPSAELLEDVGPLGRFRDWALHASPRPSGGMTAVRILELLDGRPRPARAGGAERFCALADAAGEAMLARDDLSGDAVPAVAGHPQTTTCLAVIDDEGRSVSLTMTLLNSFGAHVSVPGAGFFLNNGVWWFDPRPGRPQSLRPGARALSSVAPVVATGRGSDRIAIGGLGGRQIAVGVATALQNAIDFGEPLDVAVNRPRIHTDGVTITADRRLGDALRAQLGDATPVAYSPVSITMSRLTAAGRRDGADEVGVDARARATSEFGERHAYGEEAER